MFLDIIEPESSEKENIIERIIGIDFGTTNSLVAINYNNNFIVIEDENGNDILKSSLNIDGISISSIKRVFGRSYEELKNSSYITNSLKNALEKTKEGNIIINSGPQKYSPIQLASNIFTKLKIIAEKKLGFEIKKAVVTVPAYFDNAAKAMVRDSARIAGLDVVRLIAEPTSAAYAYGLDNNSEGCYMVYDFGGGTFDVSILKMHMGVFQVLATGGDNILGGDDIDFIISNYLKEKYNLSLNQDELQSLAKYLKENLNSSRMIQNTKISLSQEELDSLSNGLIDKTIKIAKKVLFDSKLKTLDGIILVGGSSKLKNIKKKIIENFPNIEIKDDVDPDRVVAIGAARQAWNIESKSGDLLIDVVPLSLGIELMGGLVDKIIPRNSPIPSSNIRKFTTYMDNQTSIDIHVVQGDRELANDCRSLAKFKIKNIPPMVAGKAKLEINFTIDPDGLLIVKAKEELSGQEQEILVKPTYGVSEEDIKSMLFDAMHNAENDHITSSLISKKIELRAILDRLLDLIKKSNNNNLKNIKLIEDECKNLLAKIDILAINEIENSIKYIEDISKDFIDSYLSNELEKYLKGKEIDKV